MRRRRLVKFRRPLRKRVKAEIINSVYSIPYLMNGLNRMLKTFGWRVAEIWSKYIWIEPAFIHDFGDAFHHTSVKEAPEWRYIIHEFLDDYLFYPAQKFLRDHVEDYTYNLYNFLRIILGFFWGLNCGFPLRNVVLYTAWCFHGCHRIMLNKKVFKNWLEL